MSRFDGCPRCRRSADHLGGGLRVGEVGWFDGGAFACKWAPSAPHAVDIRQTASENTQSNLFEVFGILKPPEARSLAPPRLPLTAEYRSARRCPR